MSQYAKHLPVIEMIAFPRDLQIDDQFDKVKERCARKRKPHSHVELFNRTGNAVKNWHEKILIRKHNQCLFGVDALQ